MAGLGADARITIIGGGGFIGRYVVQELAKTGARLTVVSRHPDRALFLKPLGGLGQIDIRRADIRAPDGMATAFEAATHGVNLVGILDERGGQKFAAVQAEGPGHAARAAAGVTAFVQVSAIGADAHSSALYARTKAAGEAAVTAALPHATILRPSLVFGREDAFINRFAGLAAQLPVIPVLAGGTRFQPVYVLDVAKAVVAALADPAAHGGRTYELGGPRIYTMRALLAWIAKEIRSSKPLVEVPDGVAALMGKAGDILPFAPMTSDQWTMLQRDNVTGEGVPGLAELGIDAVPIEAIAPDYLERFRSGGRFHSGRTG